MGAVAKEFESDPGLAGIGGRVRLFDIRDKPVTITTCKERHLLSLSDEFIGIIHGCNMAFTVGLRQNRDFRREIRSRSQDCGR